MRSPTKEIDSPSPLVAEQWLTTLVEAIKKEDHAVAEREYQTVRRADLIAQNGPVFWRKFTDILEVLFRQMEELFGNHVTKGKISFTRSPYGGGISINKSAYPFVSFSATPNFSESTAHFTYTVVNPEIPQNTGVPGRFLPCRFGVEGNEVVMSLDGRMFTTPESAAKFIIEKLFTIPSSSRVATLEPVQAVAPVIEEPTEPRMYSDFAWPPVRPRPAAFPTFAESEFAYVPYVEASTPVEEVAAVAEEPVVSEVPVTVADTPQIAAPVSVTKAPESVGPPPLPISAIWVGVPEAPRSSYAARFLASASRLLGGTSGSKTLPMPAPEPAPLPVIVPEPPIEAYVAPTVVPEVVASEIEPEVAEPVIEALEAPSECEEIVPVQASDSVEEVEEPVMHAEPLLLVPAVPRRKVRPQKPRSRLSYHDPRRQPGYKRAAVAVASPPEELRRAAAAGS